MATKVLKDAPKRGTTEEPTWFTETAHYLYESGGEVKHKVENSVNRSVQPSEDAERITRAGKLRVETRVYEDNRVMDQSSYTKTIKTQQITDSDAPGNSTSRSSVQPSNDPEGKWNSSPGMDNDFKTWVKNTYDNMARDLQQHKNTVLIIAVALAVIAAAAFVKAFFG